MLATLAQDVPGLKAYIGKRIEIPVHYNLWMRGARYGEVTAIRHGKDGLSAYLLVKMDHPQVRHRLKLWAHDVPYAKSAYVGR